MNFPWFGRPCRDCVRVVVRWTGLETFLPPHLGHASTGAGKSLDLEPLLCMILRVLLLSHYYIPILNLDSKRKNFRVFKELQNVVSIAFHLVKLVFIKAVCHNTSSPVLRAHSNLIDEIRCGLYSFTCWQSFEELLYSYPA